MHVLKLTLSVEIHADITWFETIIFDLFMWLSNFAMIYVITSLDNCILPLQLLVNLAMNCNVFSLDTLRVRYLTLPMDEFCKFTVYSLCTVHDRKLQLRGDQLINRFLVEGLYRINQIWFRIFLNSKRADWKEVSCSTDIFWSKFLPKFNFLCLFWDLKKLYLNYCSKSSIVIFSVGRTFPNLLLNPILFLLTNCPFT
jgi:hypothetical protein